MKFNLDCVLMTLVAVVPHLSAATTQRVQLQLPSANQKFTPLVVSGIESASRHFGPKAFAKIQASVERHQCPPENAVLFRKSGKRPLVFLVPCHPSAPNRPQQDLHAGYYAYTEYPIAFFIDGDEVAEVDLYMHGFLYNTGVVSAITDIDANGMPEFWLSGDACGESDDARCDNEGLKVLELNNGRLHSWSPPGRRISN